ncbi:hypothetical protein BJ944DRAFT_244172 [Cunninghamella echinulata]|nr:hypothetical protein BJ944DRAFT_244172 [Cunninghamella echinulata]
MMVMMMLMVITQGAPISPLPADTYYLIKMTYGNKESETFLAICDKGIAKGTHPNPKKACQQISGFKNGDSFENALLHSKKYPCDDWLVPVNLYIQGYYNGQGFNYERFFPNKCVFEYQTKKFKQFVNIPLSSTSTTKDDEKTPHSNN